MGNLKRSLSIKSTQNNNMKDERYDALDQSKFDRSQVRVMKKKAKKTEDNANKTVQDA